MLTFKIDIESAAGYCVVDIFKFENAYFVQVLKQNTGVRVIQKLNKILTATNLPHLYLLQLLLHQVFLKKKVMITVLQYGGLFSLYQFFRPFTLFLIRLLTGYLSLFISCCNFLLAIHLGFEILLLPFPNLCIFETNLLKDVLTLLRLKDMCHVLLATHFTNSMIALKNLEPNWLQRNAQMLLTPKNAMQLY